MRITMTQNQREFMTSIGNVPSWMKKQSKGRHTYVKKVYCSDCLTTHEENKHREGVR